jgi:hypothetical protein
MTIANPHDVAIVLIYLYFQLLTMAFASLLYNTLLLYLATIASYVTLVSPKQDTHQLTYYQSSSSMTKNHQQYPQSEFPQHDAQSLAQSITPKH